MNDTLPLPAAPDFVTTLHGKQTALYILKNTNGVSAAFTNYGARWVSMLVPDRSGKWTDVINGFDSIKGYLEATETYYGAIVGRYANRIAQGRFSLNSKIYELAVNNPPNHLHGGLEAFHKKVWEVVEAGSQHIIFRYISADGEEGYPGTLTVTVKYTLTEASTLDIVFRAKTDADTVVNFTNHAYFNLNGQGSGTILSHALRISADGFTPIDPTSIPLGFINPVAGTPFDFRQPTSIGLRIEENDIQLTHGNGYDHNFVLNSAGDINIISAVATGDLSGIQMTVYTTEPGLQLYTGNFLNHENKLKQGKTDGRREAFCLETQHFPDSPNQPLFPSTKLTPGEEFYSCTRFCFSVQS